MYCVNPKGGSTEIEGQNVPLYQSLQNLPVPVELVVVTVPAGAARAVVEEAVSISCKAILLIPGGFSETSHDKGPEEEILRLCREKDIRIMGPNCLGVVYAGNSSEEGMKYLLHSGEEVPSGPFPGPEYGPLQPERRLGLVELSELRHAVSPKVVVSYGNQLDVDPCDLIRFWGDDPDIRLSVCTLRDFSPGRAGVFSISAPGGWQIRTGVPIVVYKAGRTQEGQMATQSHTASIAGEYAVAKAAMKQAGLIVADTMSEHLGYIKTFSMLHDCRVRGNRTAVITNAGYEKANAADNLKDLVLANLGAETSDRLRALLPSFVTVETLLDLTPMIGDEVFVKAIDLLLASEEVDALLVSIVPHSGYLHTTDEEIACYPDHIAKGITEVAARIKNP